MRHHKISALDAAREWMGSPLENLALEIAKDMRDSVDGMIYGHACTSSEALELLKRTIMNHLIAARPR